ncbi:hypothetical protein KR067_011504 [Drosophila pandora]|nr:hypothetical protein KR067_011504 [Drosophila pandora]
MENNNNRVAPDDDEMEALNRIFRPHRRFRLRPELDVNCSTDNGLFTEDVRRSDWRLRSVRSTHQMSSPPKVKAKRKALKSSTKTRPKKSGKTSLRSEKARLKMALKKTIYRQLLERLRSSKKKTRTHAKHTKPSTRPVRPPTKLKPPTKQVKKPTKPPARQAPDDRYSLYPFLINTSGDGVQVESSTMLGAPLMPKFGLFNIVGQDKELENRVLLIPNEYDARDMPGTSRNTAQRRGRRESPSELLICANGAGSNHSSEVDSGLYSLLSANVTPSEVQLVLDHRLNKPSNS